MNYLGARAVVDWLTGNKVFLRRAYLQVSGDSSILIRTQVLFSLFGSNTLTSCALGRMWQTLRKIVPYNQILKVPQLAEAMAYQLGQPASPEVYQERLIVPQLNQRHTR